MYFKFNSVSLIIAILFIFIAYFVGIKKETWILKGFNQERIRDKGRLANVAGFFFLNSGFFLLLNSIINIPYQDSFTPSTILVYGVCTIIYVHKTLVD